MAVPCIADIDLALVNIEFLKDDLLDLKAGYTAECEPPSEERVNDSKCRTVGVAGQLCFNMKVDIAAYPISGGTSIFFPEGFCD